VFPEEKKKRRQKAGEYTDSLGGDDATKAKTEKTRQETKNPISAKRGGKKSQNWGGGLNLMVVCTCEEPGPVGPGELKDGSAEK